MIIEDQSAHDWGCFKSCVKMFWDEKSYRNIARARSVSVYETDSDGNRLKYCEATENTLTYRTYGTTVRLINPRQVSIAVYISDMFLLLDS